jgi:hypothetical protein
MAAAARQGPPGVVHQQHRSRPRGARLCGAAGLQQPALLAVHRRQADAGQAPALAGAAPWVGGLPWAAGDGLQLDGRCVCCGAGLWGWRWPLEVPVEKVQLQGIDAPLPLQVAPGANPQHRAAPGRAGPLPQLEYPRQVGVVPAADQQHRPAPERLRWLVAPPLLRTGGVGQQPAQAHAVGVVAAQQLQPLLQEGAAAEAAADGAPDGPFAAALAALGRQLQPPGQPQGPPRAPPLAQCARSSRPHRAGARASGSWSGSARSSWVNPW